MPARDEEDRRPHKATRDLAEILRRVAWNGVTVVVDETRTPSFWGPAWVTGDDGRETYRLIRLTPPYPMPGALLDRLKRNREAVIGLLADLEPCPECAADVNPMPLIDATDEGCGCPLQHCPFRGEVQRMPPKAKGTGTGFQRRKTA